MTNDNDDGNNERKPSALDAAPPKVYPPRAVQFKEPPRLAAIERDPGHALLPRQRVGTANTSCAR